MTKINQAEALATRVTEGNRQAVARLLSLIDDHADGVEKAFPILRKHAGNALVLGVTGVPGSGKSTLLNSLIKEWITRDKTVAVIAIDPSSPISGGAVLGDRIRMTEHAAHPNVFVRSFSARGELGGLSHATHAAVDCFDAAGFDYIIVETVGTGQSETAIAKLADTRLVLCPPGLGDDIQAIKAGVLEIADILVVSKGDLPFAENTRRELREMLTLRRLAGDNSWKTKVMMVSSPEHTGIPELVDAIEAHAATTGHAKRHKSAASVQQTQVGSKSQEPAETTNEDRLHATTPCQSSTGLSRQTLASLAERDGICRTLGIQFLDGGPGFSEVSLVVDERHLNFNGTCHGGTIFTLADAAFGLASNSRGQLAMGINAYITYQMAVLTGERLIARATEVHRGRSTGVYRIEITRHNDNGNNSLISSFLGTVVIRNSPVGNAPSPGSG